jgi:hypothetical protein
VARRKPTAYNAGTFSPGDRMPAIAPLRSRRGLTVLALLLIILAVIVAVVLISRYVAV